MKTRNTCGLMRYLPPAGRHAFLGAKAVRDLVGKIRPGIDTPGWLEKRGNVWRLRLTFCRPDGSKIRRGITLPDEETAQWVREYLQAAKSACREFKETMQNGVKSLDCV